LGSYFSAGNVYSAYGLSVASNFYAPNAGIVMSNFSVGIMWACPSYDVGVNDDAYMNCCFVEISYWIQESPVNTGSSNYTSYVVNYSSNSYTNSQSTNLVNFSTNTNVGNFFAYGTSIFFIANSISTVSASNCTVKYLSGNFVGAGGSMTTSTNRYSCTFTPVTFSRRYYNRVNINFNFPSNNNTATTNTYGTGQYITSYGCTARIIGSDSACGSTSTGNIFPSNGTSQAFESFSNTGRAYFSS
jgi:hypothetical protein